MRAAACTLLALLSTISFVAAPSLLNGTCRELLFGTEDLSLLFLLWQYSGLFLGESVLPALVLFGMMLVYWKLLHLDDRRFRFLPCVWAVLISISMLVGLSCRMADQPRLFFTNRGGVLIAAVMFAGYVPAFYACMRLIGEWLERSYPASLSAVGMYKPGLPERGRNALACAAMLLSWLPYMLVFYPGSVAGDTAVQIDYFMGNLPWSNHHPIVSSALIGGFVKLGGLLGSENLGVFLYAAFQSLALAFALSRTIACMREWGCAKWLRIVSILFFCLFPLWGLYAQYVGKDTLFTAVVTLYTVCLCGLIHRPEAILNGKTAAAFCGLGILAALLRNNGIYVVMITLMFCLLAFRGRAARLRVALLLGVTMLFQCLWSGVLLPALGVEKGSVREALSIPLQQTARYVSLYESEVTDEEKAAISGVLDYRMLADYDADLSDPVKSYFYDDASGKALLAYFRAWFQMCKKHPLTYVDATILNSYSYYCLYDSPIAIYRTYLVNYTGGQIHAAYPEETWLTVRSLSDAFSGLPGISLLYRQGFYTWLLLALIVLLLCKRKPRYIVCLIPAIASVLVCVASPADGDMRYYLPVVATIPLLCASSLTAAYGSAHKTEA